MKFLTKQWYRDMQSTDLHLLLQEDEQAAHPTEEYFQALYARREQEFLDYPPDEGATPAWETQQKQQFEEAFHASLSRYIDGLPEEIKNCIPDLRLLPLYRVPPQCAEMIRRFCMEKQEAVDDAFNRYKEALRLHFLDKFPPFMNDFYFHDGVITQVQQEGTDLILTFDLGKNCRFHDAVLLVQEKELINAVWFYDEIYPSGAGYEIHVLLCQKPFNMRDSLFEIILQCRDVSITRNDE